MDNKDFTVIIQKISDLSGFLHLHNTKKCTCWNNVFNVWVYCSLRSINIYGLSLIFTIQRFQQVLFYHNIFVSSKDLKKSEPYFTNLNYSEHFNCQEIRQYNNTNITFLMIPFENVRHFSRQSFQILFHQSILCSSYICYSFQCL